MLSDANVADLFRCWLDACRILSCRVCCAINRGRFSMTCHLAPTYLNPSSEYSSISFYCRLTAFPVYLLPYVCVWYNNSVSEAWWRPKSRYERSKWGGPSEARFPDGGSVTGWCSHSAARPGWQTNPVTQLTPSYLNWENRPSEIETTGPGWGKAAREQTSAAQSINPLYIFIFRFLALSFKSIFFHFLAEAAQYESSYTVVPLTTPLICLSVRLSVCLSVSCDLCQNG